MMDLLKRQVDFIRYLVKLNESERKEIAKHLTTSQAKAISQIVFNCIKGSFKIKKSKLEDLKKHKLSLYKIADKKISLKEKRTLISKRIQQITIILKEAVKWI